LSDGEADNKKFVLLSVYRQIVQGFPNLSSEDHERNLQKLFTSYPSEADFRSDLNDYLIQLDLFTNSAMVRNN
jgi:CRM1 C terminal